MRNLRSPFKRTDRIVDAISVSVILGIFAIIAGWVTHVFICIKAQMWLFLIAGAIFAPIGIFHGIGAWFGIW